MTSNVKQLQIDQIDKNFKNFSTVKNLEIPSRGWLHAIRTSMNMSLAQLARRLNKTPASVKEIEEREEQKTITLKKLMEVGDALDFQLVYALVPKGTSLRQIIEKRALQIATDIVLKTSHSMMLENQENSKERLRKAIRQKTEQLTQELPKYLWD